MNLPNQPPIFIEARCDECGELIFAERVNFPAWARLQTYWLGCLLTHAARHKNGETGRSSSAPAIPLSTGQEDETPVERPTSNNSGRSDVEGGSIIQEGGFTLAIETVPACTTCNRVGHLAADCPNEGGQRGNA